MSTADCVVSTVAHAFVGDDRPAQAQPATPGLTSGRPGVVAGLSEFGRPLHQQVFWKWNKRPNQLIIVSGSWWALQNVPRPAMLD
jgi:hypothetical protein